MHVYESPHLRRLRSDFAALEGLRVESSVCRFKADGGTPPRRYVVEFQGTAAAREFGRIVVRTRHRVEIKLGASYPRVMPELRWLTPIYHPNISDQGMVCLGGFGTHWVPSISLEDLCAMLWDMARMSNYDVRSPYNREAALWAATQTDFQFPLDPRPLRDLRAGATRDGVPAASPLPDDVVIVLDGSIDDELIVVDEPAASSPRGAQLARPAEITFLE